MGAFAILGSILGAFSFLMVILIWKKKLKFRVTPLDGILSFFMMLWLFGMDVTQNKILDLGVDYRVSFHEGVSIAALTMWYIFTALTFVTLLTMMLHSVTNKHKTFKEGIDIAMGAIGVLGIGLGVAFTWLMLYAPKLKVVDFLGIDPLGGYHYLALTLVLISNFFYTLTE